MFDKKFSVNFKQLNFFNICLVSDTPVMWGPSKQLGLEQLGWLWYP